MKFFHLTALLSLTPLLSSALPQSGNATAEASANANANTATIDQSLAPFDPNSKDPHNRVNWKDHPFRKPGPGDSRGPCPGLNTMANHGFINRNGRNLALNDMIEAFKLALNVSPDLTTIAAKVALLTSKNRDTIDALENIALHGNIEHDVSLSRKDQALGSNVVFDESVFQDVVNSNPGKDFYDPESAGKVQKLQLEKARKNNPKLRNTIKEFLIRTRESCFYLSVMGDPVSGKAPKKFVNILFREERLPLQEGWRVTKNEMNPATDTNLKKTVVKFSEWKPEPNQCNWITLAPGAPDDPVSAGQIFPPS